MSEARDVQGVTDLLGRWRQGDQGALEELVTLVYLELRRLARAQLRRGASPTLQPTELVAEAYVKLVNAQRVDWQGRVHFFSVAARTMRQVLVDRYRRRRAGNRNPGQTLLTFEEGLGPGARSGSSSSRQLDLIALEEALRKLERLDPRQAEIVTLKFFGGLKGEEIAGVLGLSTRTVKREWAFAKRWLHQALSQEPAS